jgi:DNA modification methylase
MTVEIRLGDVREVLRSLPADHFDIAVTSPPYWGLRDYGTARWEGGDPDCDHRSPTMREGRAEDRAMLAGSAATNSAQLRLAHNVGVCGRCGARKIDAQIGLEPALAEHLAVMVDVFRDLRRVLKPEGTLWLNYGDCYATSPNGRSAAETKAVGDDDRTFRDKPFSTIGGLLKAKDLCMVPNRLAIALQEDGWWVRSEIIWAKPNPMPE